MREIQQAIIPSFVIIHYYSHDKKRKRKKKKKKFSFTLKLVRENILEAITKQIDFIDS